MVSQPVEAGAPLSQFERVGNIFVEPSKTFLDILRNQSWWLPFLLIALCGYVFVSALFSHIGVDAVVENSLHASPSAAERMSKQTPAQQAQTRAFSKVITEGSLAATPVWILLASALYAGVLLFGANVLLGGHATYKSLFAVSMYASLPNAVNSLIAAVVAFAGEPETYNIARGTPASLAFYLPPDTAGWLRALASSLDLFTLWVVLLLGLGTALVAKVKPSKGILLVVCAWLLYVVIKVGIAAAFS